jgi:hypothetical protein
VTPRDDEPNELQQLAFTKTERVLGRDRARTLVDRLLRENGIELRTADDLLVLSEAMTALGGMEAAVGAMLGVAAVLRGAGESSALKPLP